MGVKPVIKSPVPKSRAKWKRKTWKKPKTTTIATTSTTAITTTATSAGLAATTSTSQPTESMVTKPKVTKSTKPHNCTTLASHTHDGQSEPGHSHKPQENKQNFLLAFLKNAFKGKLKPTEQTTIPFIAKTMPNFFRKTTTAEKSQPTIATSQIQYPVTSELLTSEIEDQDAPPFIALPVVDISLPPKVLYSEKNSTRKFEIKFWDSVPFLSGRDSTIPKGNNQSECRDIH